MQEGKGLKKLENVGMNGAGLFRGLCTRIKAKRFRLKRRGKVVLLGVSSVIISGALFQKQLNSLFDNLQTTDDVFEAERENARALYIYANNSKCSEDCKKSLSLGIDDCTCQDVKKKRVWFPWVQSHSHNRWTLLRLAQSNDHNVRLMGVEALSKQTDWCDSDYLEIAQACDARTLIGLARSPETDLRFFLPPPKLPYVEESLEDQFRKLLSALPNEGIDKCTSYFTSTALQEGKHADADDKGGLWCFGGNGLAFTQSLSSAPDEKVEQFCLQALSSHSKILSHCEQIVEHGGLQMLLRASYERSRSLKIQRIVARIIGNIAVCPNLAENIVQAGWVTILAGWLRSNDFALASHAARALANLDTDFGTKKYQPGVYLYHPQFRSSEPVYADIVFVHGLLGGAFKTWRQQDTASPNLMQTESDTESDDPYTHCWPKDWLAKDCPNIRVVAVDYTTYLSEWAPKCPYEAERRSLSVRAAEMLEKLYKTGLGNRPIIWVGHSMGGLLIKQMLTSAYKSPYTDLRKVATNTRGIALYSAPHKGAPLAAYSQQAKLILNPSVEVQELCQDSEMLQRLHRDFKEMMFDLGVPLLSFGEKQSMDIGMNVKTLIVPKESSDPGFGEYHAIDVNHLDICKPKNKESSLYKLLQGFVNDCVPQNLVENILEANIPDEYVFPDL
ncbi:unnamed protein product [Owenia fusiformis]|uniref:Protein SERAC1 n=1 Tax=Owenia fusiformis TaxID=6347 RepID=A0A8J1T4T4_OWEFU|nr:unnamed protein product [Owenia fusiformis]